MLEVTQYLIYLFGCMKVVEQIKVPIYQEMELFEEKFTQSMFSQCSFTK